MIPESELLALLDKSEEDVGDYLADKGILTMQHRFCVEHGSVEIAESLADLAERLWERTVEKVGTVNFNNIVEMIAEKTTTIPNAFVFRQFYLKPIHRIIAAIIALQRSGEEI